MLLLLLQKNRDVVMRLMACFILFFSCTFLQARILNIAVPEYNPPFIMSSGAGQIIGFDADMMNEICRRLAFTCKYKSLPYGQVFNAVKNKQADVAIGAITISLIRDEEYIFSLPYLQSFGQYMVRNDSNIHSFSDLVGKKFGVSNDSVYEDMLKEKFGSQAQINPYNFHTQMIDALLNKNVDVLLLDKATADYWYANSDNIYRLLGKKIPYGYGYGILAAKGSEPLLSQINHALLDMQADGTYIRLYSTYFLVDSPL